MNRFVLASLDKIHNGTAFAVHPASDLLATLSHEVADELAADGYEYYDGVDPEDYSETTHRAALNLRTGTITFLSRTTRVEATTRKLNPVEMQIRSDLRAALEEHGFDLGPLSFNDEAKALVGEGQQYVKPGVHVRELSSGVVFPPEKTPDQRFHEDRVKKAKEVSFEAQQMVAAAEESREKPLPVDKTRGDVAVDSARANTLKAVDASVKTIEEAGKMLKKIGVDADVQKAIDTGVKAFEPYRKLRKKGKA